MKGRFDGDLQGYMLYFIKQKLCDSLLKYAEDIRTEVNIAILEEKVYSKRQDKVIPNKLNSQLGNYFIRNEIPKGRDLSLLKAVMYRQRLKFIELETRYDVGRYVEHHDKEE